MKKKREENILIVDDVSTFFASVDIKDPKPLNQTFTISAEDMVPSAICLITGRKGDNMPDTVKEGTYQGKPTISIMGVKLNTLTRAGKRRTESSKRQHGWKPGGNGQSLGDRCPKCGGPVYHSGGVVLSRSANIDRCIMCGLTSESMSFYDAVNCRRVDIKTATYEQEREFLKKHGITMPDKREW